MMAQYTLRIPELSNAELKVTVDVERIPPWPEAWTDVPMPLPSFVELRPFRVLVQLGGEEIYLWQRESVEAPPHQPHAEPKGTRK